MTFMHDHFENEMGAAFSVTPEEVTEQIQTFIGEDYNVIIGTSQDYLEPFRQAADQHPNARFLVFSGFEHRPNLGSFSGRMYQIMYLFGTVAGSVTETGTIGIIGSVPRPELVLSTNAFTRGVRSANPSARVVVEWLGSWYSTDEPPEENDIVDDLVTRLGADVILDTTDTISSLRHICEMQDGDPSNGEFPDGTAAVYTYAGNWWGACAFCRDYCLMEPVWKWGFLLEEIIMDISRGEWLPSSEPWSQIRVPSTDSVVDYASENSNIASLYDAAAVGDLFEALAGEEGLYLPFGGEVVDAEGNVRFVPGERLDDDDLLRMCWYVDGLTDTDDEPTRVPRECLDWLGEEEP